MPGQAGGAADVERVTITDEAAGFVARLADQHGPLLFHQSGGCCDGSSPMCYPRGDFRVGASDVYLGEVAEVHVGGPDDVEALREAHRRRPVAAAPRLVEHQRLAVGDPKAAEQVRGLRGDVDASHRRADLAQKKPWAFSE